VILTGPCDLVLNTSDIADTGKWVSPYAVSAYINDSLYFNLIFDQFVRDDNNQLGFVYDLAYSRGGSYFFNLFYQKGFALEEQKQSLSEVLENLKPGIHQIQMKVRDNQQNTTNAFLPIFMVEKPSFEVNKIEQKGHQIILEIENLVAPTADSIDIAIKDITGNRLYSGSLAQKLIPSKQTIILKGIKNSGYFLDFIFKYKNQVYMTKRFMLNNEPLAQIDDIRFQTFVNRNECYFLLEENNIGSDNIILEVKQGEDYQLLKAENSKNRIYFLYKPNNTTHQVSLNFKIIADNQTIKEFPKDIALIHLKEGKGQIFRWSNFEAEFHSKTVREPRILFLKEEKYQSQYPILSQQVNLSPGNFPFLDTVFYKFKIKEPMDKPKQVGIFKYNDRTGKWYSRSTTHDKKNSIFKTRLISSGTFALMRDTFYPQIHFKTPRSRYRNKIGRLVIRITDKGKGVNDYTLKVWLNSKRVLCEYDPDWRHVVIERPLPLKQGDNVLKVRIKDYADNETIKSFRFKLR